MPIPDPFSPQEIERLIARFGSPLLILDCDRIRQQYRNLQAALPNVELHYALKPLPHPAVVQTLDKLGSKFDLATAGEINLVRNLGIAANRCIHTHPVKRDVDIRAALDYGVDTFVVDTAEEITKFTDYRDRATVLIRVSFRSPDAIVDLSRKFGCGPHAVPALLDHAKELNIRVRGLSFHVGSQVADPAKYLEALRVCRGLIAESQVRGIPFDTLDIGGGFPVPYRKPVPDIETFCAPIRAELALLPNRIRVIAEPGRYICAPAAIGVSTVMGRAHREGREWYYLDDGVYGLFSGQLYEHALYRIAPLRKTGALQPSVLTGPTCDSIDVIDDRIELPELNAGDVIVAQSMGAYTWATAGEFNFFPKPTVVSVNLHPGDTGAVLPIER